ncbi:CLUMA_CG010460, isoform A [Clunio marinus]|uniref:CLUMA_CG010460, isoform A n=1 Tax=Clunio marinus TaxID=568069 RepID=A0A1J1IA21_9DIPT|nr:CLUMA_CG010460, isoform A [Clunio marinus]
MYQTFPKSDKQRNEYVCFKNQMTFLLVMQIIIKISLRSYPCTNEVSFTLTMDPPKDSVNRLIKFEVRAKSQQQGFKEFKFGKNYFKFQNAITEFKTDFAIFNSGDSSVLEINAKITVLEDRSNNIYEPQEDHQDENEDQTF